jgi:hypothetical protein
MGRNQPEWYHQVIVNVSLKAEDEEQAQSQFQDVLNALQARFNGLDIYPPRRDDATKGTRIAGNPKFLDFLLTEGQPTTVTPFTDGFDDGVARRQPSAEYRSKSDELLCLVAQGLTRIIEKGLIPEDEEMDNIATHIRQLVSPLEIDLSSANDKAQQ